MQASYNPVFDSNGKPFKVVIYAADVIERKRLVDELQKVLIQLGECDLNSTISIVQDGSFYTVGQPMNEFIEHYREILGHINDSAVTAENFEGWFRFFDAQENPNKNNLFKAQQQLAGA